MTIQEICRSVEDLLRDDKGGTNFSPAARYAVRMLLDYAERAAALGGHLDAGPRPGGGFRVVARLPALERVPA